MYSWQLGNWVFVATNLLMLLTAGIGQWIFLSNKKGVGV
jgi:MtN3 and saliva related transmembrane protein